MVQYMESIFLYLFRNKLTNSRISFWQVYWNKLTGNEKIRLMETLTEKKKLEKNKRKNVDWTNKVILIADDVKINYLLLKAILGKTRAHIIWAEDGEQAIEYCRNNTRVDVVLMDYNMPKIDGFQATREIKKFRNDLPIISQTTCSMGTHEFSALSSTCDDYILKPISKTQLISKIGKYIDK